MRLHDGAKKHGTAHSGILKHRISAPARLERAANLRLWEGLNKERQVSRAASSRQH